MKRFQLKKCRYVVAVAFYPGDGSRFLSAKRGDSTTYHKRFAQDFTHKIAQLKARRWIGGSIEEAFNGKG